MPTQQNSALAFEIINNWQRMIGERREDRERIGLAVCNLLDEALECVRQFDSWAEAERCCDWGVNVCQTDPMEEAAVAATTGQKRDLNFPKAAVQFYRGVFLIGQSKLDTAIEYLRMSARDFAQSSTVLSQSPSLNSSAIGAALAHWALGRVAFAKREWGLSFRAYQNALSSIDSRDPRAADLRRILENDIVETRRAIHRQLSARSQSSTTSRHESSSSSVVSSVCYIPILARIVAGTPLPSGDGTPFDQIDPDNLLGEIFLDEEHARGATFGLLVRGDSMREAGILDGDYALIRKQEDAANGTIAVVRIVREGYDEEATLKKYFKENDHWLLKPENPAGYKPIVVVAKSDRERIVREYAKRGTDVDVRVDANVLVIGRVVGIWRRVD
jgi:SOS-response transcriptional repressor LexA